MVMGHELTHGFDDEAVNSTATQPARVVVER